MQFAHVLADLLASGKAVRFTAPGHSMHPVIRHGDVLLVAPLTHPARIGDILLYRACGRPVAHRLTGFEPGEGGSLLILKGDSAAFPDLPVRLDHVLGRVFAVERRGRRIDPYRRWAMGWLRHAASSLRSAALLGRHARNRNDAGRPRGSL